MVGRRARAALAVAAVAGAIAIGRRAGVLRGRESRPRAERQQRARRSVERRPGRLRRRRAGRWPGGGAAPSGARAGGFTPPSGTRPSGGPPSGGGGMGGGSASANSALVKYLTANQGSAKYLVAASGSQTTASIILATGKPVVTIGGFNGQDPAPTVSQLAAMVKNGELKYVLVGSGGGMGGPGGGSSAITAWVQAHGKAVTSVTTSGGTLYEVSAVVTVGGAPCGSRGAPRFAFGSAAAHWATMRVRDPPALQGGAVRDGWPRAPRARPVPFLALLARSTGATFRAGQGRSVYTLCRSWPAQRAWTARLRSACDVVPPRSRARGTDPSCTRGLRPRCCALPFARPRASPASEVVHPLRYAAPLGRYAVTALAVQHHVVLGDRVRDSLAELLQRPLELGILERGHPAAVVADQVVMVLA